MGRIRSGQLLVPFGIGQIVNLPNNLSMMIGGLNLWRQAYQDRYDQRGAFNLEFNREEFEIFEPRLSTKLFDKKFFKPYQWKTRGNTNREIPIYGVRFPKWHYCDSCSFMKELPLLAANNDVSASCTTPGCSGHMVPVRFIAVCPKGHIEDVPFMRWVHRGDPDPQINHRLRYTERGGSGDLGDILIECDCESKSKRSLAGITREKALTNIAIDFDDDHQLPIANQNGICQGLKIWTGEEIPSICGDNLQVVLRGASNVHFAKLFSSIYIPENDDAKYISDQIISKYSIETLLTRYRVDTNRLKYTIEDELTVLNKPISLTEGVFNMIIDKISGVAVNQNITDTEYRYVEYKIFTGNNVTHAELKTNAVTDFLNYLDIDFLSENFDRVVLVEKVRETIAFAGFTRLRSENNLTPLEKIDMLSNTEENWLPGYVIHGEGLFFEFKKDKIDKWLQYIEEKIHTGHGNGLIKRYQKYRNDLNPNSEERVLDDCFVMMHTFAHLLIKRLCYNCGYASASLKERIYYSFEEETSMKGVLIYTASSDSSGSLGGLVNQGRNLNLAKNIREALEDAAWCSADPVCMDVGIKSGQGPGSANGAACHNCAVIAETSCEEFNLLLDRATVVGTLEDPKIGYFSFT